MIRLLPIIFVPILILAGLGYWRYSASKPSLTTPAIQNQTPLEVPKTLPQASVEDRVKTLEDVVFKLVAQVNVLKSPTPTSSPQSDSKLNSLDSSVTELQARVSVLEKATPAPVAIASAQSTVYIPLGSGGSWRNTDWYTTAEYQVSLNPDNYPGYTGMNLEVIFRLVEPSGTASVRLYNVTDNSVVLSQVDTTSSLYVLQSSSSFKLPTGAKTYKLQVKTPSGKDLFIQSARIKVSF